MPLLRCKRGEGYVDVAVLVLAAILCVALAVKVFPIFITKHQLDTFAAELVREAELSGRVGAETTERTAKLQSQTGLHPTLSWSRIGQLHINEEVIVTLQTTVNIGLFGSFGSFSVNLTARATGKSEVYWK